MLGEWYLPPGTCQVVCTITGRYHFFFQPPIDIRANNDYPNTAPLRGWLPTPSSQIFPRIRISEPWEYGSLPKAWLPMLRSVDEIWAYSRFIRDCYLEAGLPPERVHVIPLGVDPEVFRPSLEPL